MDSINNKIIKKMDEIDKKIIEILGKHPEGMSYRQIHNQIKKWLKNEGRHPIVLNTVVTRVNNLKDVYVDVKQPRDKNGYVIQGTRAVITLIGKGEYLSKKLRKISNYKEAFRRYIENYQSKNIGKIWIAKMEIDKMLNDEMKEVLQDDVSDNLKRELVYAIIEAKAEVEKMGVDLGLNHYQSLLNYQGLSEENIEFISRRIRRVYATGLNSFEDIIAEGIVKKSPTLFKSKFKSKSDAIKWLRADPSTQIWKGILQVIFGVMHDRFIDALNKEMEIRREVKRELDEILKEIEREGYK